MVKLIDLREMEKLAKLFIGETSQRELKMNTSIVRAGPLKVWKSHIHVRRASQRSWLSNNL